MAIERRFAVRFGGYIEQLMKIVLSSSLALGLLLGISVFLSGEISMNIDFTLDLDAVDGVWMILGLPALSILVFLLLFPLSFLCTGCFQNALPKMCCEARSKSQHWPVGGCHVSCNDGNRNVRCCVVNELNRQAARGEFHGQ